MFGLYKVLRCLYRMTKNLSGLTWRVVLHIQHLWHAGEWIRYDDREVNKQHDKDCVEEVFQLARVKFDRWLVGQGGYMGRVW